MSDARLRDLERRATQGDLDARRDLLQLRLRSGRLDRERLQLTAYLGDVTAREVCGDRRWAVPPGAARWGTPIAAPLDWVEGLRAWGKEAAVRAAVAAARVMLEPWERATPCKACGWRNATPEQRKACPKHRENSKPRRGLEAAEAWLRDPNPTTQEAAGELMGDREWVNRTLAAVNTWLIDSRLKRGQVSPADAIAEAASAAAANARRVVESVSAELGEETVCQAIQRDLVPWALAHRDPVEARPAATPWHHSKIGPADPAALRRQAAQAARKQDTAEEARCVAELIRVGDLTKARVQLARDLGSVAAHRALTGSAPSRPRALHEPWIPLRQHPDGAVCAAIALGELALPVLRAARPKERRPAACLKAARAWLGHRDLERVLTARDAGRWLLQDLEAEIKKSRKPPAKRAARAVSAAAQACQFAVEILEAASGGSQRGRLHSPIKTCYLATRDALELSDNSDLPDDEALFADAMQAMKRAQRGGDPDDEWVGSEAFDAVFAKVPARQRAQALVDAAVRRAGIVWALGY
jgi:hypothetical protein